MALKKRTQGVHPYMFIYTYPVITSNPMRAREVLFSPPFYFIPSILDPHHVILVSLLPLLPLPSLSAVFLTPTLASPTPALSPRATTSPSHDESTKCALCLLHSSPTIYLCGTACGPDDTLGPSACKVSACSPCLPRRPLPQRTRKLTKEMRGVPDRSPCAAAMHPVRRRMSTDERPHATVGRLLAGLCFFPS